MSIRRYGIYLSFPPAVDLRSEGLGRHLAMFLKGALDLPDVRVTVVCPSWSADSLHQLFESEQVPSGGLTILSPRGKPYALRVFEWVKAYRSRPAHPWWWERIWGGAVIRGGVAIRGHLMRRAVAVHNLPKLVALVVEVLLWSILALPVLLVSLPCLLLWLSLRALRSLRYRLGSAFSWAYKHFRVVSAIATNTLNAPEKQGWVLQLFDFMQSQENTRMQRLIEGAVEVRAWYSPTAFWPAFHDIKAPRLMCVPDVVLADFPAGFAKVGGDLFLKTFETVNRTIRAGDYFVTYSEHVKWSTLVARYGIPEEAVTVIPHAPNTLNRFLEFEGFSNPEVASNQYCRSLLLSAVRRGTNLDYTATFRNDEVKFLFYASQFRPNKNVITLLRAYEYLLRKRYMGHKLILTGHPDRFPEVQHFVREHRLQNDVIFVCGLSVCELAAFYKLADLAVNPTLSEGGCPFTFAEALSVGTPVVMSDIPVTREVLTDTALREVTFFNPYDWRDCAYRIEWALNHRDELLAIQDPVFQRLKERTWADVAAEHIARLEEIASHRLQATVS